MMNLEDPATYVQVFTDTLHFSVSPDSPKTQRANFSCCPIKTGAWLWATHQIREQQVGPGRAILPLVTHVG